MEERSVDVPTSVVASLGATVAITALVGVALITRIPIPSDGMDRDRDHPRWSGGPLVLSEERDPGTWGPRVCDVGVEETR